MAHAFQIEVRFHGGLTATQQAVFQDAAARWSEVIMSDLPRVRVAGEVIDDVVIDASGALIDGPEGILGQAGPTFLRFGSALPAKGVMELDRADLARMEADGSLPFVIIHGMGHVLGIGTIWQQLGLLRRAGTANPVFVGLQAMHEFATLVGSPTPLPVPVGNRGGPGTRDGHWRERVFGSELMTGFIAEGINPLSRLTLAAFQDMGYAVYLEGVDPFALPTSLHLALMGIGADAHHQRCTMCGPQRRGTAPIVLPERALV
jgi:hypothetical protein